MRVRSSSEAGHALQILVEHLLEVLRVVHLKIEVAQGLRHHLEARVLEAVPEAGDHAVTAVLGADDDELADFVRMPKAETERDAATVAEAHDVGPFHPQVVQQRRRVGGGVLEGKGAIDRSGAAVALLVKGHHHAVSGQQRDHHVPGYMDGRPTAVDQYQRHPTRAWLAMDLIVQLQAVYGGVAHLAVMAPRRAAA
jgi:hypothetical protein